MRKIFPCRQTQTMGKSIGEKATMPEFSLHQISPMEDRTSPVGSVPDHGGSAPPGSFDMRQMLELLMQRMNANAQRMDANTQAQRRDMQALKGDLQNRMDAYTQALKGDMQSMGIHLQTQMMAVGSGRNKDGAGIGEG